MSHTDSEEIDNFGVEKEDELDNDIDVDADVDETDADGELEADTEGLDEESASEEEDSEEGDVENEIEEDEVGEEGENEDEEDEEDAIVEDSRPPKIAVGREASKKSSSPVTLTRSSSPAFLRRSLLYPQFPVKASAYAVEVISAIPHPVATHSLASSLCLTHLLTGSEDGYIRDYDVYAACNGRNTLTQPQRHHSAIHEGAIKAPVARIWWENPLQPHGQPDDTPVGQTLSPVYSLLMHSDALWGLSGTSSGTINLFTIRHDAGRIIHSMSGHSKPVSAMTMSYDEKGFISGGWDGNAIQWDLNTGQKVRTFSHGSQISAVTMRSITRPYVPEPIDRIMFSTSQEIGSFAAEITTSCEFKSQDSIKQYREDSEENVPVKTQETEAEVKSEASYDPLFDEPELENGQQQEKSSQQQEQQQVTTKEETSLSLPLPHVNTSATPKFPVVQAGPSSKKAVIPVLDPVTYAEYSTDVLLAASVDGQVVLWDRRAYNRRGVGKLELSEKCPPWCLSACWSYDGSQIYAGRRNGTIDMWDTRILGKNNLDTPRLLKTIRNPLDSGPVSAVVAFPDGCHVACASSDNIRLWNVSEASEGDITRRATPAFKIIAGHHGGMISQLLVDIGAKMMISASGNRGWSGESTRTVLVHDIKAF